MDETLLEQAIALLDRAMGAGSLERYVLIEEALKLFRAARGIERGYPSIPDQITPEAPEPSEDDGEPSPP